MDVHRDAKACQRRLDHAGTRQPRVPLAEDDHEVDDALDLRRRLKVEGIAADPKDVQRRRVPLGEVVDDDAVLCEHDIALGRKLANLIDEIDPPLSRVVGERPELGRVDDDLVPEPKQLGADGDEVNLGASRWFMKRLARTKRTRVS